MILDASVALSWHLRDERHAGSNRILERLHREGAEVPVHWWFEVRNVMMRSEQHGRASSRQTDDFVTFLNNLSIEIAPLPDEIEIIALARRHRLSFYDAAYLELAKRRGLPLASFDNALRTAAEAEAVPLL